MPNDYLDFCELEEMLDDVAEDASATEGAPPWAYGSSVPLQAERRSWVVGFRDVPAFGWPSPAVWNEA